MVNNKMKPKVQCCHHPLCVDSDRQEFRNRVKEFFHGELKPETAESMSSASNQKSIKLQTHGVQIHKGSSTCPKLLSYHAITSTTTHQLFHLTDTFTCPSSNHLLHHLL